MFWRIFCPEGEKSYINALFLNFSYLNTILVEVNPCFYCHQLMSYESQVNIRPKIIGRQINLNTHTHFFFPLHFYFDHKGIPFACDIFWSLTMFSPGQHFLLYVFNGNYIYFWPQQIIMSALLVFPLVRSIMIVITCAYKTTPIR